MKLFDYTLSSDHNMNCGTFTKNWTLRGKIENLTILQNDCLDLRYCRLWWHNVAISEFFNHSDFMWNQYWGFLKCKISHFNTFRDYEFWFQWIFALFEGWNWPNDQNSENTKLRKMAFLELLESSKLISLKIWVVQKCCNFHTVRMKCYI